MKKIKTQNKPQKSKKKKIFFSKNSKDKENTKSWNKENIHVFIIFCILIHVLVDREKERTTIVKKNIYIYIDNEWCIIYKSLGDITKDTIAIELSEPWRVKNKRLEKELLQSRREKCLIEFSHPWK